jgi:23S rRNA (guanine2445-N2)-methyltransferase / 23S rRNA (guanine2069-N7)-methyltransferase
MATAPRGLADLLAAELAALGGQQVGERGGAVGFEGTLREGYAACLWSRVASRVLLQVAEYPAADAAGYYAGARAVDWSAHLSPQGTLACEFTGRHGAITDTRFGALRLKDAICDALRERTGSRPDVDIDRPTLRVVAHAHRGVVQLYIDLAGEGLHRRGYRERSGEAPLRENLAAGVLLRAGWPALAVDGAPFLDPMCGSGTLVIEAALIAADRAPGLGRDYWGFAGWLGHDASLWRELCDAARARARPEIANVIAGSDRDAAVLRVARGNAERAGVDALVRFTQCEVAQLRPPADAAPGLVCTNPPYGERLGDADAAAVAHEQLGAALRGHFGGWQAAVLTAHADGARRLGLRSFRTHDLRNGALECRLLRIDLAAPGAPARVPGSAPAPDPTLAASPGAVMFANRITRNLRVLGREARAQGIENYRLYDADMPEYAFAIDRYREAGGGPEHLYVQEYAAPKTIDAEAAQRRRREALAALPQAAGVDPARIHLRTRQRQRGSNQYAPLARRGEYYAIEEAGHRLLVNFSDYLDTGVFLDHRITRARLGAAAQGRRFLNLFCYTASATVYAAAGGATRTLSLDMSATYLDWAARNFAANGLDRGRHELLQANCLSWLETASPAAWDLIFLDPPTFSNSARMQGVLDTQRDHARLVGQCMRLLAADGLLVFSTNAQRFRLDPQVAAQWQVDDISAATLPFDFRRNARIHRAYEIRARG